MSDNNKLINWLMQGDPAIRWQTMRDLMEADGAAVEAERKQVALQGWGARLLALQDEQGKWCGGLYTPKWISTTYTMLLLRYMGLPADIRQAQQACRLLLDNGFYRDGGINYFSSLKHSETCVTGMILSLLAYFHFEDQRLEQLAEHLLHQQMNDGGWNCQSFAGATHSSFHTTINVLEGLHEYEKWKPQNSATIRQSQQRAIEFLLERRLFRSHRSGNIVDSKMTRFSFPPQWRYDVLRALDYLQSIRAPHDPRLSDALDLLRKKRNTNGTWNLQNRHAGKYYFEMEKVGQPSRWNTLRALRLLKWFE